MEHPSLNTIEEIFGNKANSVIFLNLIFLSPSRFASFRFFRTASPPSTFLLLTEKKLSIDLKNAFVRFFLYRDAMMDTRIQLLRYYKSQVEAQWSPDHSW